MAKGSYFVPVEKGRSQKRPFSILLIAERLEKIDYSLRLLTTNY